METFFSLGSILTVALHCFYPFLLLVETPCFLVTLQPCTGWNLIKKTNLIILLSIYSVFTLIRQSYMLTFFPTLDSLQAPKFGGYCVVTAKWWEQFSITANISSLKNNARKMFHWKIDKGNLIYYFFMWVSFLNEMRKNFHCKLYPNIKNSTNPYFVFIK